MNHTTQPDVSAIAKQITIYVPSLLIPGLVNFLALAVYTRLLSTDSYGRYMFAVTVVTMAKMVVFDWLQLGLFRFFQMAKRDGRLPILFSTIMSGFLIVSIFVSLLWVGVLSLVPFADEKLQSVMWISLPYLLIWAIFDQILQINRAAIAPVRYGLISGSRAILCLGLGFSLILLFGQGDYGLMLGLILGTGVPTIADLLRRRYRMSFRLLEQRLATDLLRYSMPFVLVFALNAVPSISSRFFLQRFLGSSSLGLFAVGYDLGNCIVMMLFVTLNTSVYPLVLRALESGGKYAAKEQLSRYSIILFGLTLPASVGLALIAQPFSSLFVGEAFREEAARIIPWVALATFVFGADTFYFELAFQLGMKTKLQILPFSAAAVVNIALNFWWIPIHGVMGAVWATCASYMLAAVISLKLGRRSFLLPFPARDLKCIGIATLVMAAVLLAVNPSSRGWLTLCGRISFAAAAYATAVWAMNVGNVRQHVSRITSSFLKRVSATNF